jgi:hypothetical protein
MPIRPNAARAHTPPHLLAAESKSSLNIQFGKAGTEEWMAFFRDPSGNPLALVGRRSWRSPA